MYSDIRKSFWLGFTSLMLVTAHLGADTKPLIVAHRGASLAAPENTIPAFELAWKQGADAIEGDFQLTRDGHIVCIHDKDTKRVAGKPLVVAKSSLAELQQLDVGAYRGSIYQDTRIPTIAEVFATVPDKKKIYIEIKCGKEIIPALLVAIKKSGLRDEQVVVISFKQEVIRELKIKAPQFTANWLSAFKKSRSGGMTPSLELVLTTLKEIKADGFSSSHNLIDKPFVQRVLLEGYEYHVWTVDNPLLAKKFYNWGAKSITTNDPKLLDRL